MAERATSLLIPPAGSWPVTPPLFIQELCRLAVSLLPDCSPTALWFLVLLHQGYLAGWEGPGGQEAEVGQHGIPGWQQDRDALWRKENEPFAHSRANLELSSQLLLELCWSWPRARTTICDHKGPLIQDRCAKQAFAKGSETTEGNYSSERKELLNKCQQSLFLETHCSISSEGISHCPLSFFFHLISN